MAQFTYLLLFFPFIAILVSLILLPTWAKHAFEDFEQQNFKTLDSIRRIPFYHFQFPLDAWNNSWSPDVNNAKTTFSCPLFFLVLIRPLQLISSSANLWNILHWKLPVYIICLIAGLRKLLSLCSARLKEQRMYAHAQLMHASLKLFLVIFLDRRVGSCLTLH